MSVETPPPPLGSFWNQWGERLNEYLMRIRDKLNFLTSDSRATQNGLLLWDNSGEYPVVSINGEWVPLQTGGSAYDYGYFLCTTDQTQTVINTAKGIEYDTRMVGQGISIDGTYPTRIVFSRSGVYQINFTAELYSSSATTTRFYFWARVNGTDVPNTTMVSSTHNNTQERVASRSAVFEVSAGDYLEAMWAVDTLTGTLEAQAASSPIPASPASTLTVIEVSNV